MKFYILIVLSVLLTLSQSRRSIFRGAFLNMDSEYISTNLSLQSQGFSDSSDQDKDSAKSDQDYESAKSYQINNPEVPDKDSTQNFTLDTQDPSSNKTEQNPNTSSKNQTDQNTTITTQYQTKESTYTPIQEQPNFSHNISLSVDLTSGTKEKEQEQEKKQERSEQSKPYYDEDEEEYIIQYEYKYQEDEDEWELFLEYPKPKSTDSFINNEKLNAGSTYAYSYEDME